MQTPCSPFPDVALLRRGLESVLSKSGPGYDHLRVVDRQPNVYASSFPSEVVRCRVADGRELLLFCKYEAGHVPNAYGHRRRIAYEAKVYRQVLQPLRGGTPTFYGLYRDLATGWAWLVLDYLERGVYVSRSSDPSGMTRAARWIGRFHAANRTCRFAGAGSFLTRYDARYYRGWARRTSQLAGSLHGRFRWLAPLCAHSDGFIGPLLAASPTVIHGEYYPKNILFCEGMIFPVDWESAAFAVGEIDLASLVEGWPEEIRKECEAEYQKSAWPEGEPLDFERTLCAARLYWLFRWLGERPDWTTHETSLPRFEQLRNLGEQLELF